MRPPEFTGGNDAILDADVDILVASMRPPEFTGGNLDGFKIDGKPVRMLQ